MNQPLVDEADSRWQLSCRSPSRDGDTNLIKVDNRGSGEPKLSPEQAVKLCDRNFGIGADGVIFALPENFQF